MNSDVLITMNVHDDDANRDGKISHFFSALLYKLLYLASDAYDKYSWHASSSHRYRFRSRITFTISKYACYFYCQSSTQMDIRRNWIDLESRVHACPWKISRCRLLHGSCMISALSCWIHAVCTPNLLYFQTRSVKARVRMHASVCAEKVWNDH